MERENALRRAGEVFGRSFGPFLLELRKKSLENLDIKVERAEVLKALKGSYLLAANHIEPHGKGLEGIIARHIASYEVFVLERIIRETTGKRLRVVATFESGHWSKNPGIRKLEQTARPLGEGIIEGVGHIPIRINPDPVNRALYFYTRFLPQVDTIVAIGQPLLIFPQGTWSPDFNPSLPIKPGAAYIAQFYNLPIEPVYVSPLRRTRSQTKVTVAFGTHFEVGQMTKKQISDRIGQEIGNLKEKAHHSV